MSADADRIAQLTADLFARDNRISELTEAAGIERAAHERTKAERDRHAGAARHHDQQAQAAYADRDAARLELGEAWKQRDAALAEAAMMREALIVSWPESGDADAPNPAGSCCIACDGHTPDDDEDKCGPEHISHAADCPTLAGAALDLTARLLLLEAVTDAARDDQKNNSRGWDRADSGERVQDALAALDEKGTT